MKYKFKQTEIGQIPEDWDVKPLKEVAKVNELTINRAFQHESIEYLDTASVEQGQIISVAKIAFKDAPSRAKRIVRTNDFLISTVRPNLKHFAFIKKAKPNTIASTGFAVVSAKKVSSAFLYYYLTTDAFTNHLTAIADAHTSTYPAFNPDILEDSLVAYPPLPEQQSIAAILSSLDAKIELNQQMSQTLEAAGQAIFKHWFVDFEFPNEDVKPYRSSGGEMVESELGEIPKGWNVKKVGEVMTVKGGSTPDTGNPVYWDGNFYWCTPKDLSKLNSPVFLNTERKITEKGLEKISSGLLQRHTILLSSRAPIGYLAISEVKTAVNQGFIAVLCEKELPLYYVFFWIQHNIEIIKSMANGSTFQEINKANFRNIQILVPSAETLKNFEAMSSQIHNKLVENEIENQGLTMIRDSLLPKLMSGRIRVPVEVPA